MVLYKLNGITRKEIHNFLDGQSDDFNYLTTRRKDSYLIHAQNDADRNYLEQLEVLEIGETLLCDLAFE